MNSRKNLGDTGSELDSTLELLQNISVIVNIFRDSKPIVDRCDDRLRIMQDVMDFFVKWENSVKNEASIKSKEKTLISHQTREDIVSCLLGFIEMCGQRLKSRVWSIVPSRVNSDLIENREPFIMEPTRIQLTLGYCRTVNSVILGQTSVSRKSNTGDGDGSELFLSQKVKQLFNFPSLPIALHANHEVC